MALGFKIFANIINKELDSGYNVLDWRVSQISHYKFLYIPVDEALHLLFRQF